MGAWVLVFFLHGDPLAAASQPTEEACESASTSFPQKSAIGARCLTLKDFIDLKNAQLDEEGQNDAPPGPRVRGGDA